MDNYSKILKYCAFRDRSALEVRRKMAELKVPEQESEQLMQELLEDGFVDDTRFAEGFVRGKMTYNRWGRVKIRAELLQRGVSSAIIAEQLDNLDQSLYEKNLQYLVERWHRENPGADKAKLYRHLMAKGYTYDEIRQCASNHEEP